MESGENEKKTGRTKLFIIAVMGVVVLFFLVMFTQAVMKSIGGADGMGLMARWHDGETLPMDLETPPPTENDENISAGKAIYEMRCAVCHGIKGDGEGPKADKLQIKPANFSGGMFKFRSSKDPAPTNLDIFKVITRGLHGTAMLPWPGLSTTEKWQVAYYIKTFSDLFEGNGSQESVKLPSPMMSKPQYINMGRKVYTKAKCFECHGMEGHGDGEKAGSLKDYKGRAIRPRNFSGEILKRGVELEEIYYTIATGLNGTPMESYSHILTEDEMLALSYLIESFARKPSGQGMFSAAMNMSQEEQMGMMIDHVMKPTVSGAVKML